MQIHVQAADGQMPDAIIRHVHDEIAAALDVFGEQVTRVEVFLHDEDGSAKSGVGQRCVIEVRLAGHQPLGVNHTARDMREAITTAAGKAERAVRRRLERHREHKESHDA